MKTKTIIIHHIVGLVAFAGIIAEYPFHKQQELRLMLGTYLDTNSKKLVIPTEKLEHMYKKADDNQRQSLLRVFKKFKPSK